MRLNYFNSLALSEKAEYVIEYGDHLVTTDFYGAPVYLYVVEGHYVEMYYHPVLRSVMRISVASDIDLNKHLKHIKLHLD